MAKKKGLLSKILKSTSKGRKIIPRAKVVRRSKGANTSRPAAQKKQIKKPSINKPMGNKQGIKMDTLHLSIG